MKNILLVISIVLVLAVISFFLYFKNTPQYSAYQLSKAYRDQGSIQIPTPIPTLDPNPIVDCPLHINCGGGIKKMRLEECQNYTCCNTKKDKWEFISKNDCDEIINKPPSSRAVTDAAKFFIYADLKDNPQYKDKKDDLVLRTAKALDWDQNLLVKMETVLQKYETLVQQANQAQQVQPVFIPPMPPTQLHQYISPPEIHFPYSADCRSDLLGGFHCYMY